MKRKKFRVLPALMALCLTLSACGSGDSGSNGSNEDGSSAPESFGQESEAADSSTGSEAEDGERVLNIVVGKPSVVEDMNTNATSMWLEEVTGIHVNYEQLPLENLNEKVAMMLAGGELPDAFLNCGITSAQMVQYGVEDQFLIPLDDLIDQYAPNLIEAMEPFESLGGMDLLREVDGHIYSLPEINPCYHCTRALKMWINDDWMQKLNLEYPTTTEEFKEMLIAFRDNDPNGNGLKDEIPMSGDTDGWYTQSAYFLLGAFLPMSAYGKGFGLDGEGNVVNLSGDERFRDALAYLNDLYSEGLMDPGTLTQTGDQLKKLVDNPDVPLVGATTGGFGGTFTTEIGGDRYQLYRPLTPLKGPDGVQYAYSAPYTPGGGNFVITKDCKNPELAMEWANALYTGAACNTIFNGVEGTAWRYAEEGEVGSEGQPALWTALIPYGADVGSTRNDCWTQMGIYNFSAEWRAGQTVDPNVDLYSADGMEFLLYKTTKEQYDQYNMDEYALPALKLTEDESFTVSPIRTEWDNYFAEMFFNFVTGAWNLESDWDTHVANMESTYRMPEMIEIYQAAYNRQYGGR